MFWTFMFLITISASVLITMTFMMDKTGAIIKHSILLQTQTTWEKVSDDGYNLKISYNGTTILVSYFTNNEYAKVKTLTVQVYCDIKRVCYVILGHKVIHTFLSE